MPHSIKLVDVKRSCDLQEECLAATSSSIDEIQQLHDSIPMPHAPVLSDVSPPDVTHPSTGSAPGSALAPGPGALDDSPAPAAGMQIADPSSTDLSNADRATVQTDPNPVAVVAPASRSPSSPVAPVVGGIGAGVVLTLLSVVAAVMLTRRRAKPGGTRRTYDMATDHDSLSNIPDKAAKHMHEEG